jgi:hypothetical protein
MTQSTGVGPLPVGASHDAPTERHVALPTTHARVSVAFDVASASRKRERRNRGDRDPAAGDCPGAMTEVNTVSCIR